MGAVLLEVGVDADPGLDTAKIWREDVEDLGVRRVLFILDSGTDDRVQVPPSLVRLLHAQCRYMGIVGDYYV